MVSYQVQILKGGEWLDGMVIEMLPANLTRYLTILGQRPVTTRLRRSSNRAHYQFDGSNFKSTI